MIITRSFRGFMGLMVILTLSARAQSPTPVIYTFPNIAPGAWAPMGRMVDWNGLDMYGTTRSGGTMDRGTVYRVWNSGSFFTILHSFNGTNGANPRGLIRGLDGNLYGVTSTGGTSDNGTIFRMTPGGTLTSLASFNRLNGRAPTTPFLQLADGSFYGTTLEGGSNAWPSFPYTSGLGTVYRFTTNGGITSLFSFNGTNGMFPWSGLVSGSDNCLYGATRYSGGQTQGPPSGHGTLFKISTNGVFTSLFFFNNTNGSGPNGDLAFDRQGRLHGVTSSGGAAGRGTIFRFTTNSGLTTLIHFDGTNGAFPASGLLYTREGNLLGATAHTFTNSDPNKDFGTLFRLQPNGELTTLLRFNGTNGIHPFCEMIQGSNGFVYGPVWDVSGRHLLNGGTLIRFSDVPAILSVSRNHPMVTLTWTSWPNRSYQVIMKASPTDSYSSVVGSFTGSPGDTTTASFAAYLPTQAVFRVALLPPL